MSQNHRDGSQNLSQVARTLKKTSKSKKSALKTQTISSYFKNQPVQKEKLLKLDKSLENVEGEHVDEETNCKLTNSDSPYNIFSKPGTKITLNVSDNEEKDFKSPVPSRKPNNSKFKLGPPPIQKRKMSNKKVQTKKSNSKKSTSNNSTIQIIKDNFKYSDENPDHLQMALALSRSTYEAECGSQLQSPSKDETPNISEIFRSSKPTFLERFGFSSGNGKIENRRGTTVSLEATKPAKNRFKYITPILNIRSNEERNSLIDSKITLILSQKNQEPKQHFEYLVNSPTLNKFIPRDGFVFNLNEVYERNLFYVKLPEISQSIYKCGILLKDWNSIPGREMSPCKTLKCITDKEKPSCSKVEDNNVFPLENCPEYIETPKTSIPETSLSEVATENNLVSNKILSSKKIAVEYMSETLSIETKYSFSSPNKIKNKLILLDSDFRDSAVTKSLACSTSSTFHSFSSGRSVSPDLFESDDEKNNEFLDTTKHKVNDNFLSPKRTRERASKSFFKNSSNSIEQNGDVKSVLPNEIIDLTDDDLGVTISKYKNKVCESEIINRNCVSPRISSKILKTSDKNIANIYNLDDFEEDSTEKFKLSPEDNEHLNITAQTENISLFHKGQNVQDLNNQTMQCKSNNLTISEGQLEILHTNSSGSEDGVTKYNNCSLSYINNIHDDTLDLHYENLDKSIDVIKSPVNKNASIGDINEDFKTSSDVPFNILHEENVIRKPNSRLDDSDTQNYSFKRPVYDNKIDTCDTTPKLVSNERLDLNPSNYQNLSLQDTPKKSSEKNRMKSPYFDEPNLCDSADLNVTDYINNMLSQENYSFDREKATNVVKHSEESVEQCSQGSIVLDEELNYSSHFATPLGVKNKIENEEKYSDHEEIDNLEDALPQSPEIQEPIYVEEPFPHNFSTNNHGISSEITNSKKMLTPDSLIIKTKNVTPMPDYDKMTTPLINKELQKVGVKPLKRTRGTKLLKYIYESTHPFVGHCENFVSDNPDSDENTRVIKRRKKSNENLSILTSKHSSSTDLFVSSLVKESSINIVGDALIANEKLEDLIFERKQSVKISSCRVPLQIVWHNFIVSQPSIKENVLLYEPLQLESIHMMLKEQGFKFHIQDLLTFLDKKCITIRTAQKQGKIHR